MTFLISSRLKYNSIHFNTSVNVNKKKEKNYKMNTIVGSLIIIGLLCILGFLLYQIVTVIKDDETHATNTSKKSDPIPSPPPNPITSPSPPPNPNPSPSPQPNPNPSPSSPSKDLHSSCKELEGKATCVLGEVIPLPNPVPFPANSRVYTCKYQYRERDERSSEPYDELYRPYWAAESGESSSCPSSFGGKYEVDHNLKCINVSASSLQIPPWELTSMNQIRISSCTITAVLQINGTIPAHPDFWQSLFMVILDPVVVAFGLSEGARINVFCLQKEKPEENGLVLNAHTIPPLDLNKRILLGFNISVRGNNLDVIFIHPNNQLYKVTFARPVYAIQTFMLWGEPSDSKHNDFLSPVKVWAVENTTTHISTAPPSIQELSYLVGDMKKRWSHLL